MSAAAVRPTPIDNGGELVQLPIEQLVESPWNPRQRFDAKKLEELAESLKTQGQLAPIVVRPNGKGLYEIGAGHRRYRAATLAGLPSLLALVRDMEDVTFLELLVFENGNRNDLHALEEAAGYRRLMEQAGYTVPRIAERDGRSVEYVYGRMKLLQLTPKAKKLFLADEFTAGHAVLIARLPASVQDELVDADDGALWQNEESLFRPAEIGGDDNDYSHDVKPISVKELEKWIAEHVRFTPAHVDPVLFPETADIVAQATTTKEKVVQITCDNFVHPDARDEKVKTIGPRSWARADGRFKSKKCDHSVIGVISVGPGQGEAFRVCVAKKKCKTHWPEQVKAAKAAATRQAEGPSKEQTEKERLAQEAESARAFAVDTRVRKLITDHGPTWAKGVAALASQIKIPAVIATAMSRVRVFDSVLENVLFGYDNHVTQYAELVFTAMRPHLPGKWDAGVGNPRDGEAQIAAIALWYWLDKATSKLDQQLEREAEALVKADEAKAAKAKKTERKKAWDAAKPPKKKGGRK